MKFVPGFAKYNPSPLQQNTQNSINFSNPGKSSQIIDENKLLQDITELVWLVSENSSRVWLEQSVPGLTKAHVGSMSAACPEDTVKGRGGKRKQLHIMYIFWMENQSKSY